MNTLIRLTLLFLSTWMVQAQSIQLSMSSQFLARGEQAVLEIMLSEIDPPETLRVPSVPGVTIQSRGFGGPNATILPGRKLGYVYQFQLSTFEVGKPCGRSPLIASVWRKRRPLASLLEGR